MIFPARNLHLVWGFSSSLGKSQPQMEVLIGKSSISIGNFPVRYVTNNQVLMGKSSISMGHGFHGYVKYPDGTTNQAY